MHQSQLLRCCGLRCSLDEQTFLFKTNVIFMAATAPVARPWTDEQLVGAPKKQIIEFLQVAFFLLLFFSLILSFILFYRNMPTTSS